jgi:murein DD-endopeptidase MepM/ murein hydrolase activator NlpD
MGTISASVGLDGKNKHDDAFTVQRLLNENRNRIPGAREIRVDGIVGPKTIALIKLFQQGVLKFDPDGTVDPDGKTIRALTAGMYSPVGGAHPDPAPSPMAAPALEEPICFPLYNRPALDYQVPPDLQKPHHHRYFGAGRKSKDGSYRAHAACDLIAAPETPVLAVDVGKVAYYESNFFDVTDALVVEHDNGLMVRYGEISHAMPGLAKPGTPIARGQVIAFVGKNSFGSAMLHIEFYAGTKVGRLSVAGNAFVRRGDLVNPTAYLDSATVGGTQG